MASYPSTYHARYIQWNTKRKLGCFKAKEKVELTSIARGEIAIVRGSPSSPVLGFCVTLVAGRMEVEEKLAKR